MEEETTLLKVVYRAENRRVRKEQETKIIPLHVGVGGIGFGVGAVAGVLGYGIGKGIQGKPGSTNQGIAGTGDIKNVGGKLYVEDRAGNLIPLYGPDIVVRPTGNWAASGFGFANIASRYPGSDNRAYTGNGTNCIDCSGFTREVASRGNRQLNGSAYDQAQWFKQNGVFSENISDAQVGDFIYWERGAGKYHTGVVTQVKGGIRVVNTHTSSNPTIRLGKTLLPNGEQPGFNQKFVGVGRFKN